MAPYASRSLERHILIDMALGSGSSNDGTESDGALYQRLTGACMSKTWSKPEAQPAKAQEDVWVSMVM